MIKRDFLASLDAFFKGFPAILVSGARCRFRSWYHIDIQINFKDKARQSH